MIATAHPAARTRPTLALARVEGRQLLAHPAFVVAMTLAVGPGLVGTFRASGEVAQTGWLFVIGASLVGSGLALIAANLSALRSRRDRTEELYASLPVPARSRTTGHLLAVAWGAAAACALLGAAGLAAQVAGKTVLLDSRRPLSAVHLLLGLPSFLVVFMVLGIALARWLPTAFAGPTAALALYLVVGELGQRQDRWVPLVVTPDDPPAVAWVGLFNLGVAVVLGALAVRRHGPSGAVRATMALGLAVAIGGAVGVIHLTPGA